MGIKSLHFVQCNKCQGYLIVHYGSRNTSAWVVSDIKQATVFDTKKEAKYVQNQHWVNGVCLYCEET